jgi:hypothetical protein
VGAGMRINEIDYTPGILPLQIPERTLVAASKIVGDMDQRDVWMYDAGHQVYFTQTNGIDGLVILSGNRLRAVKNYTGIPGMITMIVGFITHRLGKKIVIGSDEPFTDAGISWLCSLLKSGGRGLTITDQSGNYPAADSVMAEWKRAMNGDCGPTEITIESRMTRTLSTKQQVVSEDILMPTLWFIGDKNIQ